MKRTRLSAAASAAALILGGAVTAHAQAPTASVLLGFNGGYSLAGTNGTQADLLEPPDTNGAVGLTQYGVFINGGYAVYNKSNGALQGSLGTDQSFWQAAGLGGNADVAAGNLSDTRLLFDASSNRWFASEITTPQSGSNLLPNQFLVAVSNTSSLLDGFKGYTFNSNPTTGSSSLFADYDTLGVNSQGVYLGATMFNAAGNAAPGTDQLAISKADLIAGVAAPTNTLVYNSAPNATGYTSHPVIDLDNGGTPTDNGEYYLSDYNTPAGKNELAQLHGPVGAATITTGGGGNVTVTAYTVPPDATQLGSANLIATGDTRYGSAPVKLGGIIYSTQAVNDPITGNSAIRLIGINALTKVAVLDQLISSATLDYYYPSVALNAAGQVVIGFSASGAAQYASSMAIVGQLNGTGTAATFGAPILLKAGTAAYNFSRWGDYSSTFIDPADPTKFWTIQEYAETPGNGYSSNWSTYVSEIGIAAAPEPSQFAAFGIGLLGLGALALRAKRRTTA